MIGSCCSRTSRNRDAITALSTAEGPALMGQRLSSAPWPPTSGQRAWTTPPYAALLADVDVMKATGGRGGQQAPQGRWPISIAANQVLRKARLRTSNTEVPTTPTPHSRFTRPPRNGGSARAPSDTPLAKRWRTRWTSHHRYLQPPTPQYWPQRADGCTASASV